MNRFVLIALVAVVCLAGNLTAGDCHDPFAAAFRRAQLGQGCYAPLGYRQGLGVYSQDFRFRQRARLGLGAGYGGVEVIRERREIRGPLGSRRSVSERELIRQR